MAKENERLIWIDLEMTGLDPEADVIIEIATVITDINLNILAEGPVIAVSQPESILAQMDDWNQKHHNQSGLVARVRSSEISCERAEQQTLAFLKQHVQPNKSPMCGNSICQDRRFLHRYMPQLVSYFHYRNLDVSTVKDLARYWRPDIVKKIKKESRHLALADIKESIEELACYRDHFFKLK